jgi:hypothetical protein
VVIERVHSVTSLLGQCDGTEGVEVGFGYARQVELHLGLAEALALWRAIEVV